MVKKRKDVFVPVPKGFQVSTPLGNLKGEKFTWEPSGLFVVFDHRQAEIHYAGERAGDSGIQFDIPASPNFLREFAKLMMEKADQLEALENPDDE
jgi:hypothetical protein